MKVVIVYQSSSFDENAYGDKDNVIKRNEFNELAEIGKNSGLKLMFKKTKVRSEESIFDLFGFTVQEHEFYETIPTPSVIDVRGIYFAISF